MINPLLVAGQLHDGIAQGAGNKRAPPAWAGFYSVSTQESDASEGAFPGWDMSEDTTSTWN
jgi:hypothetical protein